MPFTRITQRLLSVGLLLVAGMCLLHGTGVAWQSSEANAVPLPATPAASAAPRQLITRSIENLRPGMQVLAENPELAGQAIGESDIRPEGWRLVSLRMDKPGGGKIDIQLLRPTLWLVLQGLEALTEAPEALHDKRVDAPELAEWLVGRTIQLNLPEMGANGPATVTAIADCPEIESTTDPLRRVVTGTFHHSAGNLIDLLAEGEAKSLGVTDNHPFWSADRKAFVPAGELTVGERLQRADGTTARVAKITPRRGPPTPVYNLEVDAQHVYFVGKSGLLTHNTYLDSGFRVMSADELLDAQRGIWTPSVLVRGDAVEESNKWLWRNRDEAGRWLDFLRKNGEDGLIAEVPTLRSLESYPSYPHPPQGIAVHVPIPELGSAVPLP